MVCKGHQLLTDGSISGGSLSLTCLLDGSCVCMHVCVMGLLKLRQAYIVRPGKFSLSDFGKIHKSQDR